MSWLSRLWKKLTGRWKGTGYVPAEEDFRDYKYSGLIGGDDPRLNKVVPPMDLFFSKAPNQGGSNACTGFAMTFTLSVMFYQYTGLVINFSEEWHWWIGKNLHGWPKENKGVAIRNSFKAMTKQGSLLSSTWPWSLSNYLSQPKSWMFSVAGDVWNLLVDRGLSYVFVDDADEALELLRNGHPLMMGVYTTKDFWKSDWVLSPDGRDGQAHAMMAAEIVEKDSVEYVRFWNSHARYYKQVSVDYFKKNHLEMVFFAPKSWLLMQDDEEKE